MNNLDSTRYPRAAEYIASLPEGLESFPTCRMNYHVLEYAMSDFPDLARTSAAPAPIADFFAGRLHGNWFNETVGNAIYLMIRDLFFQDDGSFQAWNQKNIDRMFRNPLFRAIMLLLSPALVVIGAGKRWGAFHLGTTMKFQSMGQIDGRLQVRAQLTYPAGLYNQPLLRLHCSTFLAALVASRAAEPEVRLGEVESGTAEYLASWVK